MQPLNEQAVKQQIKRRDFAFFYLVYGDDQYLKSRLVEALSGAVCPPDDFFNFHRFGYEASPKEVAAACEQLPMMNDRICVVWRDFDFEHAEKSSFDGLLDLVGRQIETALLILWCDSFSFDVKRSDRFRKLADAIEKSGGRVVCVDHRSKAELARMLCDGAARRGCTMSRETGVYLVETVSQEIEMLQKELIKLCAYAAGGEITNETVDTVCVASVQQSVFNLSAQILANRPDIALKMLDDLLYLQISPLVIFGTVASFYNDLCRAAAVRQSGVSFNEAAAALGYKDKRFVLERADRLIERLSRRQMEQSLAVLAETDQRLKSFSTDDRLLLEQMIVRLACLAGGGEAFD